MKYSILVILAILLCLPVAAASPALSAQDPLSPEGSFVADEHPEITVLFQGRDDCQEIIDALVDAGGNWRSLYESIEYYDGEKKEDCFFLIKIMPHLDKLEMTRETMIEHIDYAWAAKTDFPYTIPDEMFREYILVYRLGQEPVTPYRALIRERFEYLVGETPSDTARAVNKWISGNIKTQPRGFFGPRPSPVNVLNSGAGTEEDIANLTSAILKTLGVPSRRARVEHFGQQAGGASWVEIYDYVWMPLYPDSPDDFGDFNRWEGEYPHNITVVSAQSAFHSSQITPSYTGTGVIELNFYRRGQVLPDFEHFGISVYNDGAWEPLDDLGFNLEESRMTTGDDDIFEAVLGDGKYLVQCGVRNYKGDPWVQTRMVDLGANERIQLEFQLDPPFEDLSPQDLQKRKLDELPEFILGELEYPDDFLGTVQLVFIFNMQKESSVRMLPDIIRFANEQGGIALLLIHTGAPDEHDAAVKAVTDAGWDPDEIMWDDSGDVAASWKCPRDEGGNFTNLPAVILIDADERIILYDEGMNLMIYELLGWGLELIKLEVAD